MRRRTKPRKVITTMRMKGEFMGYPFSCTVDEENGAYLYYVDLKDDEYNENEFGNPRDMEEAIKKYDAKLRKNFVNNTAYLLDRWDKDRPKEVKIISVDPCGHVKIMDKRNEKYDKVAIDDLYADKSELMAVIALEKKSKTDIEKAWKSLKKWKPEIDKTADAKKGKK